MGDIKDFVIITAGCVIGTLLAHLIERAIDRARR